jgi:acyl-coenzyme A synthetase/AMP-(fatty) acid ligase
MPKSQLNYLMGECLRRPDYFSMNLAAPILRHARMQRQVAALVEGERTITYGELADRVVHMAGHLAKLGVVRGDQIGLCLKDDSQQVIALLASAYLGVLAVQIDSRSRPTERARILDAFPLRLAIVTADNDKGINCPKISVDSLSQLPIGDTTQTLKLTEDWDTPFATQASSGTTGLPKFTVATHLQYIFHMLSYLEVMPPRQHRYLSTLPLYFSAGRVACLAHLLRGDTLVLHPVLFSPEEFIENVSRYSATVAFVVPSVLRQLLTMTHGHSPLLPKIDLLISGGSPFFAEEKFQVTRTLTPRFCEMYGTAASGPMSALTGEDVEDRPTSVGRPFSFVDVEIVDDDDCPLEAGATGQLRCRGPGLTSPIATAPTLTTTGFRNGWYYPGEVGMVDDLGYIFLQGRTSEVIFRGGAKIFPGEVEAVLQMHECVAEAAVVGRALSNNEQEAVAFVVLKHPSTSGELLAHCRTQLTAFKVPREIRIVAELPRNLSGKIDKRALI